MVFGTVAAFVCLLQLPMPVICTYSDVYCILF